MPSSDSHPRDVAVLVPAAGEGARLGGRRKQFRTLGGAALLVQTLRVFDRHPDVGHLVVAAPADSVSDVSDRLQAEGLSKLTAVVSGGDSRQASVRHALRAVPASVEVVLVHDAVRPFLRPRHVTAVIQAVRTHGAASLAVPVADTLRRAASGGAEEQNSRGDEEAPPVFGETVPRDGLYRMQTPQGFRRAWLEAAHADAHAVHAQATDDVELVQQSGRPVHLVPGDARNLKITTPGDWKLANAMWGDWVSG